MDQDTMRTLVVGTMKVIVISGASSKVGKTTLAGNLRRMLEGEHPKPSAGYARCRADIVSGRPMDEDTLTALAVRLGISTELVRKIAHEAGAKCESP